MIDLEAAESAFREALLERGLEPPRRLIADGQIHRCGTTGKPTGKDGAYVLHIDGLPAGGVQNWADGRGWENWCSRSKDQVSPAEWAGHLARVEAERRKREAEEAERHAKSRDEAARIWDLAAPARTHPYLAKKRVQALGTRVLEATDELLIPVLDLDGDLHGMQTIGLDDVKRFRPGTAVTGHFFPIGDLAAAPLICIGEGFATMASVYSAGHTSVVAFNCGNLLPVAKAIHGRYPNARLFICADDDIHRENNPGLTHATEAARAVGGFLAVPTFGEERPIDGTASDFNDLHRAQGLEAVRRCIDAAALPATAAPAADEPTVRDARDELPFTDLGNARRLVARHGRDLKHVPGLGWRQWDGRRWAPDVDGSLMRAAKSTVDIMLSEALADVAAAATIDDACERNGAAGRAQRRVRHALASQAEPRLRAMIALAQSELAVVARAADLDADPMAFTCANGTIDLTTGRLREHHRSDLITRLAPVTYVPDALAPTWERFLGESLGGDEELIGYIRRAIGYSLTGRIDEQAVTLLYGAGANGKSTMLSTVRELLGDYCIHVDFATFAARDRGGSARSDLMRFRGARMAIASEIGEGERLDERTVKDMTGGEPIVARNLYEAEVQFPTTAKLWWAANHLPRVRGTDEGVWRRLRLVPFTRIVPPEQRDPTLGARLLAELSGVLAWAVRGCLEWQRAGLGQAKQVTNATRDYRTASDSIGRWLLSQWILAPDSRVARRAVRGSYESWCESEGERPVAARVLADELRRRGIQDGGTIRVGGHPTDAWLGLAAVDVRSSDRRDRFQGISRTSSLIAGSRETAHTVPTKSLHPPGESPTDSANPPDGDDGQAVEFDLGTEAAS